MGRQGKCNICHLQKLPSTETDNTHLNCTVITASANELGAPPGWVTGIHKGSMPLQSFNPLALFHYPMTATVLSVDAGEEHTRKQEEEKKKSEDKEQQSIFLTCQNAPKSSRSLTCCALTVWHLLGNVSPNVPKS